MPAHTLRLEHAVRLLAAKGGLGYSIQKGTRQDRFRWYICEIHIMSIFEYTERRCMGDNTLYALLRRWFPDLPADDPSRSARWEAGNWRKDEYRGPKDT